jgi:PilZ domain
VQYKKLSGHLTGREPRNTAVGSPEGEMSAKNRARSVLPLPPDPEDGAAKARPVLAAAPQIVPDQPPNRAALPTLRLPVLSVDTQPRRFARVPTHAVGVHPEHRVYPRATLKLPLRLRSVDSIPEEFPVTLVTRDISSTGVYFLCPRPLASGALLELEIVLVSKPMGQGNVVLATRARVQRSEPAATPGWHGIAALFDDVQFDRDDRVPTRFLKP